MVKNQLLTIWSSWLRQTFSFLLQCLDPGQLAAYWGQMGQKWPLGKFGVTFFNLASVPEATQRNDFYSRRLKKI